MRVEWVMICRYTERAGGSLTIVGAGVDTVLLPAPGDHDVPFVLCLSTPYNELQSGGHHELIFTATGPDPTGELTSKRLRLRHDPPDPESYPPGWTARQLDPFLFRVPLNEEGPYTFTASIDGQDPPARVDCRFFFNTE